MTALDYKGDSPGKIFNRKLVWIMHENILGEIFYTTPHVFLASKHCGDLYTLMDMKVPPDNIWAVEREYTHCISLIEKSEKHGCRVFSQDIKEVCYKYPIRSIYLDFTGTIEGSKDTTIESISTLPENSVVSVTYFCGREHKIVPKDREKHLKSFISESTKYKVTLVQQIYYNSKKKGTSGSPMGTWTFYIGPTNNTSVLRFDLRKLPKEDPTTLWNNKLKRSEAARKANITRKFKSL